MKKGISVILCCYNSESRLPKTLEYLAKQEIRKEIPVELLVVNNASTDRTKEVALSEWKKYDTDFFFRVIDEETPGQMFARRKGGQESQYEYILFCDDDNWLQSDYLQKAFDLMEANPRIGALSGQTIAVSDMDLPEWFPDFQISWAVGEQADKSGDVSKKGWIWGAGLMTRNDLISKVLNKKYPFLNQGRTGKVLTSGDDVEICKRILLQGNILYYEKSLLLWHYLPPGRLTWAYKKQLFDSIELSNPAIRKYNVILYEMDKSTLKKVKGILRLAVERYILRKGFYGNELNATVAFFLKSEWFAKDLDYKSIIKFVLDNRKST